MKKKNEMSIETNMDFWTEEVNGNALGFVELEDVPKCGDLILLDYNSEQKHFVVYSEIICTELLILEEITKQEYNKYASEWKDVATHISLGDLNYFECGPEER